MAQKASDFNDCMLKIIDIIKDQMKRPGQDFKFTLEQPDGGRGPFTFTSLAASGLQHLTGPNRQVPRVPLGDPQEHLRGRNAAAQLLPIPLGCTCGHVPRTATRPALCVGSLHLVSPLAHHAVWPLAGYIESVQGKEVAGFCNKPTLLWTNCRALIDACHGGFHRSAPPHPQAASCLAPPCNLPLRLTSTSPYLHVTLPLRFMPPQVRAAERRRAAGHPVPALYAAHRAGRRA